MLYGSPEVKIYSYPDTGQSSPGFFPDISGTTAKNYRKNYNLSKENAQRILDRVNSRPHNAAQRRAIDHIEGPLLVLAGAGTGKTSVITNRIANIVGQRITTPRRILAVTFTNKAAREMKERTKALFGEDCRAMPTIKTLHGLCSNILRHHSKDLGYSRHVEIAGDLYSERFMQMALKSVKIEFDALNRLGEKPIEELQSIISLWKNNLLSPGDVLEKDEWARAAINRHILSRDVTKPPDNEFGLAPIYVEYQRWLKRAGMIDVDDLLRLSVEAFRKPANAKEILAAWQNRYDFILVDEFQDTNIAQNELIKLLGAEHQNVCVVGDDDQSIYGWRAADVGLIRNFPQDWKGSEVIKLEENYRCTQPILDLANHVIAQEEGRHEKELYAAKKGGLKPGFSVYHDAQEEAASVMNKVVALVEAGDKSNAILVRSVGKKRVLIKEFELAAQARGLNYEIWASDDTRLGEEKDNVYSLLTVIHDPVERDYALIPILKYSSIKLNEYEYNLVFKSIDEGKHETFWEAIRDNKILKNMTDESRANMQSLAQVIQRLHQRAKKLGVKDSFTQIAQEAIEALYPESTRSKKWMTKLKPTPTLAKLQEIYRNVASWEKPDKHQTLLMYIAWNNRIRILAKTPKREEGADVVIATYHAVKGLEFNNVFMPVMVETAIPSKQSLEKERKGQTAPIDEERRLAYVGITRARDRLWLSRPYYRKVGRKNDVEQYPSRFIADIESSDFFKSDLIDKKPKTKSGKKQAGQRRFF